jgi:hypothetical protein
MTEQTHFPDLPRDLLEVAAAPMGAVLSEAIRNSKEFRELQDAAKEEAALIEVQRQFSRQAAIDDHNAEVEKLRSSPSPDNIAALKRSTTSDDRLQRYGLQHQAFGEKIAKLRKKSLPALQKLTRAIVDRILQIGAEAEAEEVALYSTRGLPSPAHSAIKDHCIRAAQELRDNLHFQERAGMGLRFEKFLNLFEIKKT